MQHTLAKDIPITGIGLHSGKNVYMVLKPAPVDHGVVFKRTDLDEGKNIIPALYNHVTDTRLCTLISNEHGARVGTIEHLMAAIRACDIDNLLVELDAAEVPIMDGSSQEFVAAIGTTGLAEQSSSRRALKILKKVTVQDGDKEASYEPSNVPIYAGRIVFPHPVIGTQDFMMSLSAKNFRNEVADCRTFGFLAEVEMLRAAGLALGGSLDNAIVLDGNGVMNPGGLRRPDEFVRHKTLDAVGDLHLAGMPILGKYYGFKGGHALNNALLHAIFADPSAYDITNMPLES